LRWVVLMWVSHGFWGRKSYSRPRVKPRWGSRVQFLYFKNGFWYICYCARSPKARATSFLRGLQTFRWCTVWIKKITPAACSFLTFF